MSSAVKGTVRGWRTISAQQQELLRLGMDCAFMSTVSGIYLRTDTPPAQAHPMKAFLYAISPHS